MKKLAHPGFTWIVIFAISCCLQGKRFVETGLCLLHHPIWRKCKVGVFFKSRLTELKEIRIIRKLCSAPEKIWWARDLETPLAHTHTKMYKSTHVHMNTCSYVCTHRYKCMHKCTCTHTHICPWMQTHTLTRGYTMCTQVHIHTHAWVNTCVHACTHTTIMCPPRELIKQILNAPVRTVTLLPPPLSAERIPPTLQSRLST